MIKRFEVRHQTIGFFILRFQVHIEIRNRKNVYILNTKCTRNFYIKLIFEIHLRQKIKKKNVELQKG